MSEPSIFDGVPYIYAEMLKGKRVPLTIDRVEGGAEFVNDGRRSVGFNVHFKETPKLLGVVGVTVRRQLAAACGTDDLKQMQGKRVVLYPVKSTRSASGLAVRIAPHEGV